jgi:squalene synthase HpnC
MTSAGSLRSGKSHRDENFPVASWLIHPRHRAPILAFYQFVRTADDIADHAQLTPGEKLALLDQLEADLDGRTSENPEGVALRSALAVRGLSPRHAKDLLTAFRSDVTKLRYRDWDDLMGYCAFSAMPVGRFVLDVHGESEATWPASDALCAALQIINHLQDCKADYSNLDRVYVPLDALAAAGLGVEALGEARASPALLACLRRLADRTEQLLRRSDDFASLVQDRRLALEIAVIVRLARRLTKLLMRHDPLSERVHLGKAAVVRTTMAAVVGHCAQRLGLRHSPVRIPLTRDP